MYGASGKILSNNGSEFNNEEKRALGETFNIRTMNTAAKFLDKQALFKIVFTKEYPTLTIVKMLRYCELYLLGLVSPIIQGSRVTRWFLVEILVFQTYIKMSSLP